MRERKMFLLLLVAVMSTALAVGCTEDDPEESTFENNDTNNDQNNDVNNDMNNDVNNDMNNDVNNDENNDVDPVAECQAQCEVVAACQDIVDLCGDLVPQVVAGCQQACEESEDARGQINATIGLECSVVAPLAISGFELEELCGDAPACMPQETDYSPGADDTWPECIADDGDYLRFEMTISSAGRVASFETIADLLWRIDGDPSSDDFINARDIYATAEGLDSRVQRREDEHYPAVSDGMGGTLLCRDEGVPAMSPDRCVGPAKILPIINDAFQQGIMGNDPKIQAARLEGALLWFLYVSTHKEAITCTAKKKDCDSAYAYYTGDFARDEGGIGLAGYVREIDSDTHDRIWDGILAVRCWRDLDNGDEATDLETRDKAVAQLDVALLHGVSLVVIDRALTYSQQSGDDAAASEAFLKIMGGVLDRAAQEIDADAAGTLRDELAKDGDFDVENIIGPLQALFPCP